MAMDGLVLWGAILTALVVFGCGFAFGALFGFGVDWRACHAKCLDVVRRATGQGALTARVEQL
jgi:hypothetical protein